MSFWDEHGASLADAGRALHEPVVRGVRERLREARDQRRGELAAAPGDDGAGDITYAIDDVAHEPIASLVEGLGARGFPIRVVAEGPGELVGGPAAGEAELPPIVAIIDPIDGTRPLMHDMRSGWSLIGFAIDRGADTRLRDIEVAVQTEIPTTGAATYRQLVARRGHGAEEHLRDVDDHRVLASRPLRAPDDVPLDNGYFAFTRFLPVERERVAALEQRFFERAVPALGLEERLLYPDSLLCVAGQLVHLATGAYRMLADLRAWLGEREGLPNFTCKPYDLATALVFEEAGVPVLDATGAPLDAPLDTETRLDVVAYGNARLRQAFEPHLCGAMDAF